MRQHWGRSAKAIVLGVLAGLISLAPTAQVAAAAPERETVTLTIRCAESKPAAGNYWQLGRNLTAGRAWGRGWAYQWYCVTLRDGDGKEEFHAWIDFRQWGGSAVDLEVISPAEAQLRWAGAPAA